MAQYDWELDQLDMKTTFLYGNLDEEIFMTQFDRGETVHKKYILKSVCAFASSIHPLYDRG